MLLVVLTAALYAWRISEAPVYLSPDEAIIAADAHTLASTGHDVTGQHWPLYFRIQMPGEERWGWFTPAIFYAIAAFLKVAPLSERVVRLPTVCVGIADVVLVYLIGRKLFTREAFAWFAAGALALAPAHFMLSRFALDYLYPLPFALGWLLCLLTFLERPRLSWLFAATLCLGVGFYSYIAAVLLMAMYAGITGVVLLLTKQPARAYIVAAAGFALPLVPFAAWFLRHPTAFSDTASRYGLYDASHLNALQGVREFLSYTNLERLSSLYWTYFSPSFLFFAGDGQMTFSTRAIGIMLMPLAVLLPFGVYQAVVRRPSIPSVLVLIGLVTAPAAAILVPEPAAVIRAVALLPFAALTAAFGLELLWTAPAAFEPSRRAVAIAGAALIAFGLAYGAWSAISRARLGASTLLIVGLGAMLLASSAARRVNAGRVLAAVLLLAMPVQFARFGADYFGDYRVRSSSWFSGNLPGALEQLIDRAGPDTGTRVYFATLQSTAGLMDTRNRWMDAYWRFYTAKHRREDLLARSGAFDPAAVGALPPHSLVLANVGDRQTDALVRAGSLRRVATIPELDRDGFFLILERP
jgi:4-amino-4-deoxy-L-arabinose transferase-like glycosyltransferase